MTIDASQDLSNQKESVPAEFDRVARAYDLLTTLNPGYTKHLRWSAQRLDCMPGARILDLCCGTGLSTEALVREYPSAGIVGLDGSAGMLERARKKKRLRRVEFVHGDAMDPEGAGVEGRFDAILMAYGIRNMPDPDLCIGRLAKLLEPGGRICFHEYSVADSLRSRVIFNAVAGAVIIPFGAVASRSPEIFRYLRRSVVAFDGVTAFEDRLRRAGLVNVRTESMDGWQKGIVHSFLAERPA
jgi:ubiquinone/menaquinone biosynthesis C-methylase UbiE